MRSFIALKFGEKEKDLIYNIFKNCVVCKGKVKEVEKNNYHLTFAFFPNLSDSDIFLIEKLIKELRDLINKDFYEKKLLVNGINGFPNLKKPRVLFLDIEENKNLFKIYKKIKNFVTKNGIDAKISTNSFKPHITLMRIKEIQFLKIKDFQKVELFFEDIHLFKSTLTKQGPIYEKII